MSQTLINRDRRNTTLPVGQSKNDPSDPTLGSARMLLSTATQAAALAGTAKLQAVLGKKQPAAFPLPFLHWSTQMAKKKSAKKKSSSGGSSKKKASRKKTVAGRMGDMMDSAGKGLASAARATGKALGVTGTRRKKSAKKKK